MGNKECFLQRRKDFHEYDKEQTLGELNKAGVSQWFYEDGYFYTHIKDTLLLLKSEFENYVFNTLVILSDEESAIEMEIYSPREVIETALDIMGKEEVYDGEE